MTQQPIRPPAPRRPWRDTWWLPLAGGVALIAGLIVIAILLTGGGMRLDMLGDIVLMLFIVCPAALLLFPIVIVMAVLVSLMGRASGTTERGLRRLHTSTRRAMGLVERGSIAAARASIAVSERLAPIDRVLFSLFDPRPNRRSRGSDASSQKGDSK